MLYPTELRARNADSTARLSGAPNGYLFAKPPGAGQNARRIVAGETSMSRVSRRGFFGLTAAGAALAASEQLQAAAAAASDLSGKAGTRTRAL